MFFGRGRVLRVRMFPAIGIPGARARSYLLQGVTHAHTGRILDTRHWYENGSRLPYGADGDWPGWSGCRSSSRLTRSACTFTFTCTTRSPSVRSTANFTLDMMLE